MLIFVSEYFEAASSPSRVYSVLVLRICARVHVSCLLAAAGSTVLRYVSTLETLN